LEGGHLFPGTIFRHEDAGKNSDLAGKAFVLIGVPFGTRLVTSENHMCFVWHRGAPFVTWVHSGGCDRSDFVFGQIDGRETAPLRPEALEFLVLVRRHEIAGDLPVAGHRDGALLGEHAIAAEIPGEFGGGHGWDF
jgi:hypothetical protein